MSSPFKLQPSPAPRILSGIMLETVTRRATESPSMERRLSAILATDVVGYSRLMGEDEAGTLAALKSHRAELIDPKAAQYNGGTIKLTHPKRNGEKR